MFRKSKLFVMTEVILHNQQLEKPTVFSRLMRSPQVLRQRPSINIIGGTSARKLNILAGQFNGEC